MAIHVNDDAEFDRLLESLASDVVLAHAHHKLYTDLAEQMKPYEREFRESWTFWWLTMHALRDSFLTRLGRIYDQRKGTLSLRNLLLTVRKYAHLFDEANFRKRLAGNQFVDRLAADARRPEGKQLADDIGSVTHKAPGAAPALSKLLALRHQKLAHTSSAAVLSRQVLNSPGNLTFSEIKDLLDHALRLVNRYSSLFKASQSSTSFVGAEDYKFVLKAVRDSLDEHERRIEEQVHRAEAVGITNRSS